MLKHILSVAVSCFPEFLGDNERFVTSLGPQQPAQLLCELSSCKSAQCYRWGKFGAECFDLQCFLFVTLCRDTRKVRQKADG